MTDKKMPAFRIIFRTRDKQKFDCATVWPGKFPDSYDISPVLEWSGGQYPKMALAEALQRVANKDGWLSLVTIGQKRDAAAAAGLRRRGRFQRRFDSFLGPGTLGRASPARG